MQKGNGGGYNGNGHDPDEREDDHNPDNIVHMPTLAERDRMRREKEKQEKVWRKEYLKNQAATHGPMINLPPVTKYMFGSIFLVHLITQLFLSGPVQFDVMMRFGFVPAEYTGGMDFTVWSLVSPFSYAFLHGSWTHLFLNGFMLLAFGSGMERWIGGKRMLVFFVLCSVASAFIHLAIYPHSEAPVIGASGGLSGMFAAMLILMQQRGAGMTGRYGIWPFVALWIGISVIFGMMQAPGGGTVAWAAHIGGFAAGFVFLKPVMKYVR